MDGIGPNELTIANLIKRVGDQSVEEVILALPATVEGDTTNYYIYKMLHLFDVSITSIARGVAIGDELQYADEITLGRSIANRLPFDQNR
jgi:recombination protein RecR